MLQAQGVSARRLREDVVSTLTSTNSISSEKTDKAYSAIDESATVVTEDLENMTEAQRQKFLNDPVLQRKIGLSTRNLQKSIELNGSALSAATVFGMRVSQGANVESELFQFFGDSQSIESLKGFALFIPKTVSSFMTVTSVLDQLETLQSPEAFEAATQLGREEAANIKNKNISNLSKSNKVSDIIG